MISLPYNAMPYYGGYQCWTPSCARLNLIVVLARVKTGLEHVKEIHKVMEEYCWDEEYLNIGEQLPQSMSSLDDRHHVIKKAFNYQIRTQMMLGRVESQGKPCSLVSISINCFQSGGWSSRYHGCKPTGSHPGGNDPHPSGLSAGWISSMWIH